MSDDKPAAPTQLTKGSGEQPTTPRPPFPVPRPSGAELVAVGEGGVMLRNLDELLRFAKLAVTSGAAPKGMSEGAAAIAIQAGLERGLGVLGGLQQITVINGATSWRGQGAAALIQNSPVCKPGTLKFWSEGTGDSMKGVAVAWRVHYPEASRAEFTAEDARKAGLLPGKSEDSPWRKYPQRMLMWRAFGFLARDIFPDVLGGFPLAEEAADFEERPAVTAEAKREMLPPPKADPLMELLGVATGRPAEAQASIEAQAAAAGDGPPFDSHEEADRAIAEDEGQADLFESNPPKLFEGRR
jgi:hypothetical protein